MSINLQPLTVKDYQLYLNYYQKANYEGYQTNFHSLLLWNEAYQTQFYYNDRFLITLCHYDDFYFWNLPLTTKEYFQDAMDTILEYCDDHQMPFLMDGILEQQEKILEELYPNRFIFKHRDASKSYIYDAQIHRTLSGKKMQKRRNHYNAFLKMYENNYIYRSCTIQDREQISELLDKWADKKGKHLAIQYEKQGVLNVLNHLNELDYKMSCIEINGKIEAIILGSQLNHQTVQIHVEKANAEIRGLYVAIYKLFLENEFSDVIWVNREEDMGIESLRIAKQRLYPIKLLDQAFAYQNQVNIRKAVNEDVPALKERWLSIFKEDTIEFLNDYFCNTDLEIYLLEIDHMLVSTVYLRKLDLKINNQLHKAYYIEGVSTHHLYHQQGYMKQLLSFALSQHPDNIYFLQAYNWDIYNAFDFNHSIFKTIVSLNQPLCNQYNDKIYKGINSEHFSQLYLEYTKRWSGSIIRELPIDINGYQAIYNNKAYALYTTFNDVTVVTEIIYTDKNAAYQLLNELILELGLIKVICEDDLIKGESLLFVKYNKDIDLKDIYFNEYI